MGSLRAAVRESVREVVVVVSGILLAFGLQAWWDARRDREGERVLLQGLLAEFAGAVPLMDFTIQAYDRLGTAAYAIGDILAAAEAGTVAVPDSLMPALFVNSAYNPTLGTLSEAQSSGRIGLIQNDELRAMLAGWPGLMEDAGEEPAYASRLHEANFHGLLSEGLAVAHLLEPGLTGAWLRGEPARVEHGSTSLVPVTHAVENYVADRARAYSRAAAEMRNMRASLDRIVEALEEEMMR